MNVEKNLSFFGKFILEKQKNHINLQRDNKNVSIYALIFSAAAGCIFHFSGARRCQELHN